MIEPVTAVGQRLKYRLYSASPRPVSAISWGRDTRSNSTGLGGPSSVKLTRTSLSPTRASIRIQTGDFAPECSTMLAAISAAAIPTSIRTAPGTWKLTAHIRSRMSSTSLRVVHPVVESYTQGWPIMLSTMPAFAITTCLT